MGSSPGGIIKRTFWKPHFVNFILFKVCFGHILFDTSSCHVLSLTEENIDHMENLNKDINFFYCHQMKVKWNWFIFYYDRFIVDSSRVNAFGKATTAQLNNTLHRIWQKGSTFQLGPPSKTPAYFSFINIEKLPYIKVHFDTTIWDPVHVLVFQNFSNFRHNLRMALNILEHRLENKN